MNNIDLIKTVIDNNDARQKATADTQLRLQNNKRKHLTFCKTIAGSLLYYTFCRSKSIVG